MYTQEEMVELTNSDLISRVDIKSQGDAAIVYILTRWRPGTLFTYSRRYWRSLRCALEIHGVSRTVAAGRIEIKLNRQESLGLTCALKEYHRWLKR